MAVITVAVFFFEGIFPVLQLHEFFSKMGEPILKIPKIVESPWFDTLHDGLRFLNWIPDFR